MAQQSTEIPHLLSRWEVDEFIEEVEARPRLWMGRESLWVRSDEEGDKLLALRFQNGQPSGMYCVKIAILKDGVKEREIQRYAGWLIDHLTTRPNRIRVEEYLQGQFPSLSFERIQQMSLWICNPGGKYAVEPLRVSDISELTSAPTPLTKVVPRSRYLKNLLK